MSNAPLELMTTAPAPFLNLIELARSSVTRFATRPLFGEARDGAWRWTSYAEWHAGVEALRVGLAALGVHPGDRIAVVSRNCAAWATAAYATYGLGAAFVPMYEVQRPDDWEFILRDCGATVVFARTPAIATALEAMRPRLPALRHVLVFETSDDDPRSLRAVQQRGRAEPSAPYAVAPDDVAGLVYTSGTTGFPKGVILTHANLTSNVAATIAAFPIGPTDRTLSFLPWAHVYGQVCELHILIAVGASTAFNADTEHLLDDLREVKPTILVAVPRIFNRLHASVRTQIERRPRLIQRLFWRGLDASIRRRRGESLDIWDRVTCWLAGFLFAAIRRKLGGQLRYAISASATLSREVGAFIDALGIEVYEGYGLTETSPVVAMNRPGKRKLGSVGLPIANVRIELDTRRGDAPGEGEIIVHGPNVMRGYHARPEENARVFTADGGLHTGDLGRIDADGYLFITGRIKEQYKLENGKYVMPSPLEEKLALSPFIRNVMLYGADRPYNVALVVIDADRVRQWAAELGLPLANDLTQDERVCALIRDELDRCGKDLRSFERPRECTLTTTELTIENGLLTPTLKLKRREMVERFGAALAALYDPPPREALAVRGGEPLGAPHPH
ncbi:MAG: long-chain fatty acid--CoA ligase [Myxococcales bacterium]|nr:long-chain fatty acid--CoA ligase [Myxococcales bacterium]